MPGRLPHRARVTFICSKTDDISLMEAQDSLDLGDELGPQWAELDRLSKSTEALKKELADLKESKGVYTDMMDDADDELEVWEKLKVEIEEGKTVFAPLPDTSSQKRKAKSSGKPRKRCKSDFDSDDDFIDDAGDGDSDEKDSEDEEDHVEEEKEPLSGEQIDSKISDIKATKKKARQERAEVDGKLKALTKEAESAEVCASHVSRDRDIYR